VRSRGCPRDRRTAPCVRETVMEINGWLVEHYLGYITVGWFDTDDLPPECVQDCLRFVIEMKKAATARGDLDQLRLAFDHILGNPQIDASEYGKTRYPFDDADVREIIAFARSVIWPDAGDVPPGGPPGIRLVRTRVSDWKASQAQQRGQSRKARKAHLLPEIPPASHAGH